MDTAVRPPDGAALRPSSNIRSVAASIAVQRGPAVAFRLGTELWPWAIPGQGCVHVRERTMTYYPFGIDDLVAALSAATHPKSNHRCGYVGRTHEAIVSWARDRRRTTASGTRWKPGSALDRSSNSTLSARVSRAVVALKRLHLIRDHDRENDYDTEQCADDAAVRVMLDDAEVQFNPQDCPVDIIWASVRQYHHPIVQESVGLSYPLVPSFRQISLMDAYATRGTPRERQREAEIRDVMCMPEVRRDADLVDDLGAMRRWGERQRGLYLFKEWLNAVSVHDYRERFRVVIIGAKSRY